MANLKDKNRLIIVTGAAGFIGSSLVRHLNDQGIDNILVVDEFDRSEKWKNLVGKKFHDLIEKDQLFDWLKGREKSISAIVHLGACSDTMELNSSYLLDNNYRYSVKLAEYALDQNIRLAYASSAATYGKGCQGFLDDENQIPNLKPLNMYGFSKQLFDQWALSRGHLDKLIGLKYFNVFGPNEHHKAHMASAITRMVPQILKDEKVRLFKSTHPELFADGEQKRDFIYSKDAVRMTYALLEKGVGGIYNIGSGVASTWNDLAHAVYHAVGKTPNIEYIDMPEQLVEKYQNYSKADRMKIEKVLGDQVNCMDLKDSVSDYVKNHLLVDQLW